MVTTSRGWRPTSGHGAAWRGPSSGSSRSDSSPYARTSAWPRGAAPRPARLGGRRAARAARITALADVRADRLPTGQARIVELARALATAPKVLLLDEPASGQDEQETAAFSAIIREVAADGVAVVLVEHDIQLVMGVCAPSTSSTSAGCSPRAPPARCGRTTRCWARTWEPDDEHRAVGARPAVLLRAHRGAPRDRPRRARWLGGRGARPNGAGKTTFLSVLAGLHPATAGSVVIAGRRVNGAEADDLARAGLCLVPEGRGIFPNLTVHEHLRMATHSGRRLGDIEQETYERFPRLAERRRQVAGTLSAASSRCSRWPAASPPSPRSHARRALDGPGAAHRGGALRGGRRHCVLRRVHRGRGAVRRHRVGHRRPRRHPRPREHRAPWATPTRSRRELSAAYLGASPEGVLP